MLTAKKIGFIGGGNMAEALIKGLVKAKFPGSSICVSDPSDVRRKHLGKVYGVKTLADNREVACRCDLIVLAVKPQIVQEAVTGIADIFSESQLLISILAGIDTASLESPFDGQPRIIRAMPNTPALVGCGATAICPGRFATVDDLSLAGHLFEAVGTVVMVAEAQIDAVTGLSGSGPAYVFNFIEALADGGVLEGLPRETALALAAQTVLGAARLVQESGEHPMVLKDRVCSPGGTTIAGVSELEAAGFSGTVIKAVSKASKRSRELGGK